MPAQARPLRHRPGSLAVGTSICFCPACGLYFKSDSGFRDHRTGTHEAGTRRCLDTHELAALGMSVNTHGQWITRAYNRAR